MNRTPAQHGSRRKSSLAFPSIPLTKRGDFIAFLEDSGTADILLEIFSRLFAEKEKLEDPLRLIHKYLRQKAPARQLELDTLVETLQQDILQTAYEIEEVKERLRSSQPHRQSSLLQDKSADDKSADAETEEIQRWQVKPDPGFRPTFNLAATLRKRTSEIQQPKASMYTVETEYETVDETADESEHDIFNESKSTETSPQISRISLQEIAEKKESKTGSFESEDDRGRVRYTIYDPRFFKEHIPMGFWKNDFSLDESGEPKPDETGFEEEDVPEETEPEEVPDRPFVGRNYKFQLFDDSSWLPERDAVKMLILQRYEELTNEHPSGGSSVASVHRVSGSPVTPPLDVPLAEQDLFPPKVAQQLNTTKSHYEWIQKTYGPMVLRETKPKPDSETGTNHKQNRYSDSPTSK